MSYFTELGLAEPILRALATKGYNDPTPIQRQSIPALLEGRDLLGIAQTGTGKTAAFALPSLHRLAADPKPKKPASCRMLVLSPTRELAAQIAENMRGYARNLNLQVDCVFGGVPIGKQAKRLVPGTDILVATPGRLLDLIDSRALTLGRVEIFVLDEADQMMDLGFIHSLKRVAALLPAKRQSLFFSATMPKSIEDLGRQFIHNPVRVEVAPQSTTAERVEQYVTFLNQMEKQALLTLRIRAMLADKSLDRGIVFTRTKHGADRVARHLGVAGIEARAIHGNKTQAQRTAALEAFRQGSCPILVATDIAARGIDVSGVSHVFNFELPNVPEQYVHRIGRTARAGADGVAISFCAPDEKPYLRDIERLTGVKPTPMPLPDDFLAEAARLPTPPRRPAQENEGGARHDGRRNGPGRGDRPQGDRARSDRSQGDRQRPRRDERGPAADPQRKPRTEHANGPDGEARPKRRFRPRDAPGVGQHRGRVRQAS
ncbi:DEAD/DEAH box helicase-like protein [Novosphingobium nitrogenifigens DSM 19370]|uniref:DEAD/DEAH box helicase-like protein n=1 Tax=Novosphingobium nitrogenifigens DSM 19370 TaxID=983920 RepID=F1Z481_9SPHN|nr:DEAD/DEAH box helicase [Novosphingobium nitrogenifigens]EGD60491.1 DEAD/DEAH box helicase-like protein [Novosphingobium nitrogenifigens DSM 19370]